MKKIALLNAVFLFITFAAKSNTYTVASTADAGLGSLRAAVDSANANPGMDSIVVTLGPTDTILALSPFNIVSDSLMITGLPCSNPTVSGGNIGFNQSLFFINNVNIPLTLNYLNFTNCLLTGFGPRGAVVYSAAYVYLNYCYFNGNSAISTFGGFGGSGGAIFVEGGMTVKNCSFSNNVASTTSGGGSLGGGAVFTQNGNFYNCTFYSNQANAFASALYTFGNSNVINCTFANNSIAGNCCGGVIFNNEGSNPNLNIANNIFWGNTGANGNVGGIWLDNSANSGGCNILQADNTGFNTTGTDILGVNPKLGSFGYHGGCVPTIPIGCSSIAQNHATCPGATGSDARGVAASAVRDAGAFELPEYIPHLGPNISQCGGSVTLTATPPVSINTYLWSTGAVTDAIVASTSGYYHVLVTDTFGCRASDSIQIYIKPKPYVNLGADTTQCGGSITLNAGTPGDLYHWSTAQTTQTISVSSSNTYKVTVTDPNSACSASSSLIVTIKPEPVVNLGPDIRQCGGNATLNAGNPGDSYFWSTDSTNETMMVATSGTYSVTVTNESACSASASIDVYIEPAPFVSLGNDTMQCGGNISLDAGNPGYLYQWSNGAGTQTINVNTSDTYSVTATNPNSFCSASGSVNVIILPVPVVNLGPDTTQCGGSVTLYAGNPGCTYIWSNNSTTDSIIATTPGLYSITVTNAFSCAAANSVNVYIQTVPSVYLGRDVRQCGGSVTLDAGNPAGFGYLWSTTATSQTIQAAVSNAYSVTVTNVINGCSTADTINVIIDTIPVVNLGPDTTQCGGSVTLNAGNAGASYLWSDNSVAQTLVVTASGIYRVTVTTSNGCSATDSIKVTIHPIPVVTLSLPANVCITNLPFTLTGGQPTGGTYFEADTAISLFAPRQQGIGPHEIVYVFMNNFGCVASDSASVFVRPQPLLTSISPPYLCTTSSEINLNQYVTPPGGVYTGIGVSGNFFYPDLVPPGFDTVVDVYTDTFGCMDTLAYPVYVHRPVHVILTSSVADFTICQSQSITFTATGAELYQFFVNDTAQGNPSTGNTFTTTTLNNHSIIYVVGSNPCSTDTSEPIVIDVITPPVVSAGSDTTINLGQTVELHGVATGDGNLTYLWTPGNGLNFIDVPNPTYSGSDSITFWFKATDSYGCADSAKVSVYVFVPDNVLLPTVITPNGDGFNDVWKLNSKINLDGSHLVIFDRWGQIVYETDNYANNWGGTFKSTGNVLPDDTYYYVLKVPAQHNHVYEGPVNIISGSVK